MRSAASIIPVGPPPAITTECSVIAAGIEFPGWDPTRSNLIAEVATTEEPPRGIRHDATGVHALHTMEDGRTVRVVVTEQQLGPSSEPTLRDLSEALITVYGTDFGIHNPTWISRFTDMTRQAAAYRAGRVLLAGDDAPLRYTPVQSVNRRAVSSSDAKLTHDARRNSLLVG